MKSHHQFLCHKYCLTYNEYGLSNTEQKCLSCSDNYTFDYWSYLKNDESYCIPEGYYYDKENNIIKECNSTSYKYFNISNNKIICFKSDYECPPDYPYLNNTTNECLPYPINIQQINIKINNKENITLILDEKIGEETYQEYSGFPTDDAFSKFASLKYLKNNNNINGSTIDLGICENILKQTYHIPFEDSLYALIIDIKQEGMKIPKVEYEIFDLNQDYILIQLDLSVCKGVKIIVSTTAELSDNIDKHNSSSGYYNDYCYTTTSKYGTDICLKDRRKEFIDNNMTLCEKNCELIGYDYNYKKRNVHAK